MLSPLSARTRIGQQERIVGMNLFAGPTLAAVVEQLTRLTGRPALPPLWALGYHQSRWGYRSDGEMQITLRWCHSTTMATRIS